MLTDETCRELRNKSNLGMFRKIFFTPYLFLLVGSLSILLAQARSREGDTRTFKLSPLVKVTSVPKPTMNAGRLGVDLLMDGKLPKDGWRSTWTAWFKVDPVISFDLGAEKNIGIIRIFFQPTDRTDELAEVRVEVSRDGENYLEFNEYVDFKTEKGRGAWAEIDLRSVKARFFRLSPKFQGWGHLWGEVEFWEVTG